MCVNLTVMDGRASCDHHRRASQRRGHRDPVITPSPASPLLKSRPCDCAPLRDGQEGELRPQLLDRFGMSVIVHTMPDIASRTRMVLDRLAFEQARSRWPQTLPYPSQFAPIDAISRAHAVHEHARSGLASQHHNCAWAFVVLG